jgi:hypothetical protein
MCMKKWWMLGILAAMGAAPAAAQEKFSVSVGYAFAQYLEEDGGNAPLGIYLSFASPGKVAFDGDFAWHRDPVDIFDDVDTSITLNTFTAAVGPRIWFGEGSARPYLHVLGGLRYDTIEGESNTAFGGMSGLGVDIPAGESIAIRLGADFQIFFDEGENIKTLRLTAGITF